MVQVHHSEADYRPLCSLSEGASKSKIKLTYTVLIFQLQAELLNH